MSTQDHLSRNRPSEKYTCRQYTPQAAVSCCVLIQPNPLEKAKKPETCPFWKQVLFFLSFSYGLDHWNPLSVSAPPPTPVCQQGLWTYLRTPWRRWNLTPLFRTPQEAWRQDSEIAGSRGVVPGKPRWAKSWSQSIWEPRINKTVKAASEGKVPCNGS